MPPVKELHYFDRSPAHLSGSILANHNPVHRLLCGGRDGRNYRRKLVRRFATDLMRRHIRGIRFDLRYFLGHVDDDWYLSLFAPGLNQITGEATPAYSMLAVDDVQRVAHLLPEARVVFVLRNPIERAWSHLRYQHADRLRARRMSLDDMKAFVDSRAQTARSAYASILDKWMMLFPDRCYIDFYDRIVSDSRSFLDGICNFLGLERHPDKVDALSRPVNAALSVEMPDDLHRHLASRYEGDLIELSERLGPTPARWLERARVLLD